MSTRALVALSTFVVSTFLGLGHVAGEAIEHSTPMEQVSTVLDGSYTGTNPNGR
jgi:hypothetical protein